MTTRPQPSPPAQSSSSTRPENTVRITGHLGRYPELRYTPAGTPVINCSLAHTEQWTDPHHNTERKRTHWITIVQFGEAAEKSAATLNKGDYVRVEGKLSYREWEQEDGRKRSTLEVQAFQITLLRRKTQNPAPAL